MVKTLLLTGKTIKSRLFRSFFVMVLVAVAVYMINVAISYFRNLTYQDGFVRQTGLYDGFMYAGSLSKMIYFESSETDSDDEDISVYDKLLDSLAEIYDRLEAQYGIESYPITEINDRIYVSYEFLCQLSVTVSKGVWFDDYSYSESDYVPVVVGHDYAEDYKIGEIIDISGSFGDKKGVVIGILRINTLFIAPDSEGSALDLNYATEFADKKMIIGSEYGGFFSNSCPRVIKLPDSNRNEMINVVYENLADTVYTFTYKDMAERAHEENVLRIRLQIILSVMIVMTGIVGISCANLLDSISQRKRQAIYFLCGMNEKVGLSMVVIEGILRLFVPAAVGLAVFFSYCQKENYEGLYVDSLNCVFTLIMVFFVFVLTSVGPLKNVRNASPADVIRSE